MISILHLLAAAVVAWQLLGLNPLTWLLAIIAFYPVIKLLGLVIPALRVYSRRFEAGMIFVPWFAWKIIYASWDVARIVLNPQRQVSPAVVSVTLRTEDKRLITLLACLVTLTPGTLALDYRGKLLYIHVLDTSSVDSVQQAMTEIETRVLAWVYPKGGRHDG
jgi:multicomponent Na+:H+ antiporter subunit E